MKTYTTPVLVLFGDVENLTHHGGGGNADLTIGPTGTVTGTPAAGNSGNFYICSTPATPKRP